MIKERVFDARVMMQFLPALEKIAEKQPPLFDHCDECQQGKIYLIQIFSMWLLGAQEEEFENQNKQDAYMLENISLTVALIVQKKIDIDEIAEAANRQLNDRRKSLAQLRAKIDSLRG